MINLSPVALVLIAMDELTNRSRTFAEAVVTMVWLVLLALALNKPKWKSEVPGLDVPNFMLFLAGSTIITGICPLLACCVLEKLRAISDIAALFSAVMLFFLAYWIALFTVSDEVIVFWVALVFLACMVLRVITYYSVETEGHGHPERTKEFHIILDGSHEFTCCMTGIHFLWLESLALGGLINKSHGIQNALSEVMGISSILCCAVGLGTMYMEMAPSLTSSIMGDIVGPIFCFDIFMIFSIGTVLGAAMWKSLVSPGLLLLLVGPLIIVGPLIAFFVLVLHVSCPEEAGGSQHNHRGGSQDTEEAGGSQHNHGGGSQDTEEAGGSQHNHGGGSQDTEDAGVSQHTNGEGSQDNETPKLAPLGLTKLMVTGFLTVSISVDSSDVGITNWFLVFAAAAIVSGLTWRLLTQDQVRKMLENKKHTPVSQARIDKTAAVTSSANTASFCAHFFVAIATVLLMFEVCNVKMPMSAAAPAPARAARA